MTNNIKNITEKTLKVKNMLQVNQNKLLKLIYSKNKTNNQELINLKKELKKISNEQFRNKLTDESDKQYESRKTAFMTKKAKRLNELSISLIQNPSFDIRDNKTIAKKVKYNNFWKIRKETMIPYGEVPQLRNYKQKKVIIAHSIYVLKIKRWTQLSEKRAKAFITNLNSQKNHYPHSKVFGTYRNSLHHLLAMPQYSENRTRTLKLNEINKNKYLTLKNLKTRLLSKLPSVAFKPATKYQKAYSELTAKQLWLANKYVWLKIKSQRRKGMEIDFFKTFLGQQFLMSHKQSKDWMMHGNILWNALTKQRLKINTRKLLSNRNWARKFQAAQKRAWFYTNTVYPKKLPYFFNKNSVTKVYPFNKFIANWRQRPRNPWLNALISKRAVYSGFLTSERREFKWLKKYSWIPMLRNKIELRHKKNRVYFHRSRLLYSRDNYQKFDVDKKARIKQILAKTILPFYGNLRLKQFAKITQKALAKKTNVLSRDDIKLGYLERRLDVVVYRLNLAPNIFWARKLIQDGSIFVNSVGNASNKNEKDFEKMYANYKYNAYPLKLRDPQNLYKKTKLNVPGHNGEFTMPMSAKLKFLLEPLRNVNYLTQPGDVILCAPGALINQYKSNKILWQKPIPTHLLAYSNITETKNTFKARSNVISATSRKEQTNTNVGVVLFNPTFADLHKADRIQRSFLRWMSL